MMRQSSQRSNASSGKLERKHVEKNRRNKLKGLYNNLFSLLPTHLSIERMTLPDQVGETVNYIKSLQNELEKKQQLLLLLLKQKQQNIISSRKRQPHHHHHHHYSSSGINIDATNKQQPLIQVVEMGSSDVVLISGLEDIGAFQNAIRILHQHGLEVTNAVFQLRGNSTLHILHQQTTTLVYEKLKQVLVQVNNGSSSSLSCCCTEQVVEESESLDSSYYDILFGDTFPAL